MVSILIPAYKEPYLQKTIDDLLAKAEGKIEIIVTLDGYWPDPPLKDDKRVHVLHFGKSHGMRAAINGAAALAHGDYLMKCDAHCIFGQGFDRILLQDIQDNWVVIPRRYQLDVEKWEVMSDRPIDYEKLIIHKTRNKFHGEEWRTRAEQRKDILIDETMSFQGSCWFMSRKHWDALGELDEQNYGRFVQEPTEIGMKTWASGGKIMVNKNTWYAHKHRKFSRTHQVKEVEAEAGNAYALNLWKDEYAKLKRHFSNSK